MANESLILDTFSVSDETNFQLEKLDVPPAKRKQQWASSPDSDGDALIQQSHYDNVAVPFQIRCVSQASIDLATDLIAKVNAQLVEAELRATAEPTVQCLPAGLPGYWTPAGSTRTGILVIQSGTVDERPLTLEGDDAGYFLTNPMPVIRGTLNCLPGVYASVLEAVTAVSASAPTVQISVPNVPGDMLAPTELTITDTVTSPGQERKYADWGMDQPAVQAGRTNLVTNPKATVNATGWTPSAGTVSSVDASSFAGFPFPRAFQASSTATGTHVDATVAVTNGHTYRFSVYGWGLGVNIRLEARDAGGTLKANSPGFSGTNVRNDLSVTADSTGNWTVRIVVSGSPGTMTWSGALMEESTTLQAFFDGDSPNTVWNGTANASTSTTVLPTTIDATQLVTTNYAGTATTRTGAYNGNNVIRGNPLLPTYQQICATPAQTVTGVYQVYARIYALTTDLKIRLKYQVGDGPFKTLDWAAVPVLANGFSEVFLGTITVPDTIGGVKPTWVAVAEMNSATIADTCDLNFLRLIPASLGSGRLRAPLKTAGAVPTIIAYDDAGTGSTFDSNNGVSIVSSTNASPIQITANAHGLSNGQQVWIDNHTVNTNAVGGWVIANVTTNTFTLTGSTGNGVGGATGLVLRPGRTAPVGGSQIGQANINANPFSIDSTKKVIQRTALSDAVLGGRLAIFGIQKKAEVTFQADVSLPGHIVQDKEIRGGIFVRYKDGGNWLLAVRRHRYFITNFGGSGLSLGYAPWTFLSLFKMVNYGATPLGDFVLNAPNAQSAQSGAYYQASHDPGAFTVRIAADAAGNVSVYSAPAGGDLGTAKIQVAQDADLKTGGALATGGFGLYDECNITSGTYTRTYDNELGNSPTSGSVHNDAVIRALRSAVVKTVGKDGGIRQDAGGTFYGRIPIVRNGVRLALPPAGVANRVPRITVAVRQNDIDTAASLGMTDSTQIGLVYRACYLTGPGAG